MAVTRNKKTAEAQRIIVAPRRSARNKTAAAAEPRGRVEKRKSPASKSTSGNQGAGKATTQNSAPDKSAGAKQKLRSTKQAAKKGPQRKRRGSWRRDKDGPQETYYGVFDLQRPHIINKYLEVQETGSRGRGVFTRIANIPAGTLLLQEPVLLRNPNNDNEKPEDIRRLVGALNEEDQRKFVALSHHGVANTEEGRYGRNAFADEETSHLWFWISLINHECAPNCSMMRVETDSGDVGNVRTLKDLPEQGTELSIDYIYEQETVWTVNERKARTQNSWGFECACATCTTPRITNRAIREMFDLKVRLTFAGRQRLKPGDIEDRQFVDAKAGRAFELLTHWGLTQAAYTLAEHVVHFYSKIEDDLARAYVVDWTLRAARLGQCIWGLESLEKTGKRIAVTDIEGMVAPDPRFFLSQGKGHSNWVKLVKKLPQLMAKQLYGNVRPHPGRDISDIPSELYDVEEEDEAE